VVSTRAGIFCFQRINKDDLDLLKRRDQGDEMTLSSLSKVEDDEPNWKSGGNGLFNSSSGSGLFGDDGPTAFKADSLFGSSNSDLGGLSTARKPEEVKWYYRDPSGQVQGPFEAQEMQDWYKAGFFTPTLMLCRDDETVFEPLMVLIRKVGNEDQPFLTARPPVTRPSALSAGGGDMFGAHVDTGSGLFRNGPDLQSKYMPFGSTAAPTTPGGSIMDSFLGGGMPTAPLYQNPYNTYGNSLLRDNRWNTNEQAQASPSWLNHNPAELFGGPTSPLGASPFINQQPNTTMFGTNMNSPGLFDYQRPIDPMDHQHQQYNFMLQQKQQQQSMQFQHQFHQMQFQQDQQALSQQQQAPNAAVSAAPPQQQTSPPTAFKNTPLESISNNNNVIGSNHASPVMRPNILSSSGGWGSAPGTPIGTDAPSSPWGSIVSAAIPTKVSEELQAKAPGAQSPRAPSSPKKAIEKPTKTTTTTTSSTPAVTATSTSTINTATATIAPPTAVPATKTVIQSFAEIQLEEQQKTAVRNAAKTAAMEQAATAVSEKAAQATSASKAAEETSAKPSTPAAPSVPKPIVSLREIQEEELRIANEKKAKHAKQAAVAITTPSWAASNNTPLSSTTTGTWSQPTHKPLSLREIQEMEAKQAAEAKKASAAQYLAQQEQLANATPNTLSWGVVVPNSKPSPSNASNNNQSANATNAAVWTAPTGPKKTLREIQQEEELAMKKKNAKATKTAAAIAAAAAASSPATNASSKAYAVPSAPAAGGAWTTVTSTRAPKPTPAPAAAPVVVAAAPQPTQWTPVKQMSAKSTARAPAGPSEDFRRWCRKALRDLNSGVNQEEIVDMLLSFPVDANASEIIEDVIYANSLRIDGKRFAQEFMKRRKADIAGRLDIVTAGLEEDDDDDFKVVVTKKGKKKNNA
jgi:PERQ amino acid-rich with GYF domain-containing protein